MKLEASRHPVVEQRLVETPFVANDVQLGDGTDLVVLTGPNASGQSCYLRQIGLIQLMAQIGSWVPARSATVGIADRIFTRVGAVDDLAAGQSTFMVEMAETANILHHASDRSLVLLDEIGRGTATFDGLSIAWAVVSLAGDLGTVFATHITSSKTWPRKTPTWPASRCWWRKPATTWCFCTGCRPVAPAAATASSSTPGWRSQARGATGT